jgi:hypothetical protein
MNDDKIVMYESDEAAHIATVSGWVSRHGQYFGPGSMGEKMARWNGATHQKCANPGCDGITPICGYVYCDMCRVKKDNDRYASFPVEKWDGKTPLSIFNDDHFFFSSEDIESYCEYHEVKPENVKFVRCEPSVLPTLNLEDFFEDVLPDNGYEFSQELIDAEKAFNDAVAAMGVVSWIPADVAVRVTKENL